jgi:sortase A
MKTFANFLTAASLLAFGYLAINFLGAWLYQTLETRRFVAERNRDAGAMTVESQSKTPMAATPTYPPAGSPVALMRIPRLGLSTLVLEGAEESELKLGPGHIYGTSLPGDGGNVGIAGHRDTFFRPLRHIRKDDTIQLATREQEYHYQVASTRIVAPEDVQVLHPLEQETLTLVTCYPFDFAGPAPKRFVVRADCVDCIRQKPIQVGDIR